MNPLDKVIFSIAPQWGLNRLKARVVGAALARHFEAADTGRRTSGWPRNYGDANAVARPALTILRANARELVRNNGWAKNGLRAIGRNTVGWGIVPKAIGAQPKQLEKARQLWDAWAGSIECDSEARNTFYGIQRQALDCIVESGEVLIRRRRRLQSDGLTLPIQLQVLEPDFLDVSKDYLRGDAGGPIIQGVEFDKLGRRAAYWLYEEHPGASIRGLRSMVSKRIPASEVIHIFRAERAGQVRGISWFATALVKLKDFDEYEDATLVRQKIAAMFAAFVTDVDGTNLKIGTKETDEEAIESFEPGMVVNLPPGKAVEFAVPPTTSDHEAFTRVNLRGVAAGLGITYEDLTGDYSAVNFSSARMARIAAWANVHDWRYNMLIPHLCDRAWLWAMEAAVIAGQLTETPSALWTPPPMPMIEPDKEGLAIQRLIRTGVQTISEAVREQGRDPETHFKEYAEDLKKLDELGIVLDSDARKVTQAGLNQTPTSDAAPPPAQNAARVRQVKIQAKRLPDGSTTATAVSQEEPPTNG